MDYTSSPLPYWVEKGRRVLFITFKGDCRFVNVDGEDTLFITRTISDALSCVRPGDILQFLPGKYWPPILYDEDTGNPPACKPVKLYELQGLPDVPITLRGLGMATVLNGGLGGVPYDSMLPEMKHFAFFKLQDCAWIEFENFYVESCWPTFLYVEDSSYVTVRNIKAADSRYLVYARGMDTHHVLVEGCHWRQDPTGSMWRDILWLDSKRKRYFYYNGGIFGSVGISGSVVVRGNTICDAFNGLRMKCDKGRHDVQNFNMEIYGNSFIRVRDNPVEPERGAVNWWVHHNAITNAHAWFSLDEVSGGFWYYFANTGTITDKPGNALDPNTGGKVYKYDKDGAMPEHPVFAFNNSYWLCAYLIKDGSTTYLTHMDNAVLFAQGVQDPGLTEERPPCPMPFATGRGQPYECGQDGGDDRFAGGFEPAGGWGAGNVRFDFDLCNLPKPKGWKALGQEAGGLFDSTARFVDPKSGNLRLEGPVPLGGPVTLKAGVDWPGQTDWTSGPDTPVGAYDGTGEPVPGPAFVFLSPADYTRKDGEEKNKANKGYVEMPRLVRIGVEGGVLVLTFSTPLAGDGPVKLKVKWTGGRTNLQASVAGRELRAEHPKSIDGLEKILMIRIPDTLKGTNGQFATLWSSVFKGLGFYLSGRNPAPVPPAPGCFCDCGAED